MGTITFDISELIKSPSALTREQGGIVYKKIIEALNKENKVVLDFENIESIITPFLNVSIGKLYETYSSAQLKNQLSVINLPKGTNTKFQIVIDNAKTYYSNKGKFNEIVKYVMND